MKKSFLKNSIWIFCWLVFMGNTNANFSTVNNNCVIHLDKSFYVTGEVMWYKMYLPKNFDQKSVTLKVSLLDKNGRTKHYSFHQTEGKTFFSSYYKIPFDTRSGMYSLVVSGIKTSTRKTIQLAEAPVPIYNDLETVRIAKSDLADPASIPASTSPLSDNPLKVTVAVDKNSYKNRDQVNVIVKVTDAAGNPIEGNCSVAVTDQALAGEGVLPAYIIDADAMPPNIIPQNINNSIHVRGLFLDKNKNPKKVEIMGVFSPKENKFVFTESNEQGEFFIEMPNYSGDKPIQFVNHYEIDEAVEVQLAEDVTYNLQNDLVYTEGILNYLKLSRERKKIFQLFDSFESNVQTSSTKFDKIDLKPNKKYTFRNYTTFKDIPMFFTEVLTYLKFKKKGKRFIAQMTDPTPSWEGFYPGKPLFIIDGKVTRDADYIARLEYSHIEQFDLFFDRKELKDQFNVIGKSGVVEVTTDLPKLILPEADESRIFSITGLQPKANFPVFDTDQLKGDNRLPFFRPQLYWNPDVTIQPNGEGRFSFTQTDDLSTFEVHVTVQGANGEIGYGNTIYEVEMR